MLFMHFLMIPRSFEGAAAISSPGSKGSCGASKQGHNPKRLRMAWSTEETENLRQAVREESNKNWRFTATRLGTRSLQQAHEKWLHMSRSTKKEPWSPEEDAIIVEGVQTRGTKWAHIAEMLPGRDPVDVPFRYESKLGSN